MTKKSNLLIYAAIFHDNITWSAIGTITTTPSPYLLHIPRLGWSDPHLGSLGGDSHSSPTHTVITEYMIITNHPSVTHKALFDL